MPPPTDRPQARTDSHVAAVGDAVEIDALPLTALVARLSQQLLRTVGLVYTERGITAQPLDAALLNLLARDKARLTELAARMNTSKQALTFVVDRLERAGYLHRELDPADRRAKLIALTPAGQAAADVTAEAFRTIEMQWRALAGAEEWPQLRAGLARIASG
jgi:DNA-binding MarR family transcriptional regulator